MDSLDVTSALVLHYYASRKRVQCGLARLNRGTGRILETGIRLEGRRCSILVPVFVMYGVTRRHNAFYSLLLFCPRDRIFSSSLIFYRHCGTPHEEPRAMTRFFERGQTTPVTWNFVVSLFDVSLFARRSHEDSLFFFFFRERE